MIKVQLIATVFNETRKCQNFDSNLKPKLNVKWLTFVILINVNIASFANHEIEQPTE